MFEVEELGRVGRRDANTPKLTAAPEDPAGPRSGVGCSRAVFRRARMVVMSSRLLLLIGLVLGAVACVLGACAASGADTSAAGGSDGAAAGGTTTSVVGGAGGGVLIDAGSSGGGSPVDGCSDELKKIYVLAKNQELYGFDPPTLTLTKVGLLACPQGGGSATPFSMSVDRNGTAWVVFNDGSLFRADIKTAACQATSYVPGQQGYKKFGMGFVSNAVGSSAETLFLANEDGVATLDTQTLKVTPIGTFGFSAAAELTGTGDARLFGFFFGFPPYIAQIDKATSQLQTEAPLDTVDIGTGFAFAFWGGDFWIFTAPDGSSSQIDRYQPASNTTTTVKSDLGFKVIGAGVSTCAPFEVPR